MGDIGHVVPPLPVGDDVEHCPGLECTPGQDAAPQHLHLEDGQARGVFLNLRRARNVPAWCTVWIISQPHVGLVVKVTAAGTPQHRRRSVYASSSTHACGQERRRSSRVSPVRLAYPTYTPVDRSHACRSPLSCVGLHHLGPGDGAPGPVRSTSWFRPAEGPASWKAHPCWSCRTSRIEERPQSSDPIG